MRTDWAVFRDPLTLTKTNKLKEQTNPVTTRVSTNVIARQLLMQNILFSFLTKPIAKPA
ncbi:MAG: hypothetical protein PHV34_07475 [Verrucomicrobiae bacterium]|nr:hypothetical protein [Verrucomicrobiae bacterium]